MAKLVIGVSDVFGDWCILLSGKYQKLQPSNQMKRKSKTLRKPLAECSGRLMKPSDVIWQEGCVGKMYPVIFITAAISFHV